MNKAREKVLVAMSGGVDSSVAAAQLLSLGYDVIGATYRMWPCDTDAPARACCGIDHAGAARASAGRLGIPHYVLDAREPFEDHVLRASWSEYARGRTPNPCVLCNERIKFGWLLEKAEKLGASRIATGHHARILAGKDPGKPLLVRGRDRNKDQSYFLFSLSSTQLDRALMPVGELTKEEVRNFARELGLPNADRPESQDACFTDDDAGFAESLRRRLGAPAKPGDIVDPGGNVLGRHEGVHHFTIGQRRGLGIALGQKAFVLAIRPDQNEVVVGVDEDALRSGGLSATGVHWFVTPAVGSVRETEVQIRYRHRPVKAWVERTGEEGVRVRFHRPQRAVAPGQAVVFYDGEVVLGGGWIEKADGNA